MVNEVEAWFVTFDETFYGKFIQLPLSRGINMRGYLTDTNASVPGLGYYEVNNIVVF
jgi:hypothetical protein